MDFYLDREAHSGDLSDINILIKQLSPKAKKLTVNHFNLILQCNQFVFARLGQSLFMGPGKIIGMAYLVINLTPTRFFGVIEDVVVDENYRGQGIAKKLTEELIKVSRAIGLKHLDLTSAPRRVAANELYKKLGFKRRETSVYRLELVSPSNIM